MVFLFCVSFSNLRHGICCCINTEASISIHISARSTALKAMFHVPLLYFEHLPLQRSLHGPAVSTPWSLNPPISTPKPTNLHPPRCVPCRYWNIVWPGITVVSYDWWNVLLMLHKVSLSFYLARSPLASPYSSTVIQGGNFKQTQFLFVSRQCL